MTRISKYFPTLLSCFVSICLIPSANAQDETHHFTANVGGGYTSVVGGIGNRLDGGGNFQAGAGFNFNRYLGVLGTFSFNQLGVTRSALDNLNVPDGNGRVYTFTVDPKFTLPLRGRASVYVLGGG